MTKEKNQETKIEHESYSALLSDISVLIEQAQGRAYQAVDNIRVQTYWQIGERIVRAELEHQDRASYGQEVIKRLADDLDISERNLYNAVAFYKVYPILQTVSAELSWSHYVELTKEWLLNKFVILNPSTSLRTGSVKDLIVLKEILQNSVFQNDNLRKLLNCHS